MSDPAPKADDKKKPDDDHGKKSGGGGGGPGPAWAYGILAVVLISSGVFGTLLNYLGALFQILKQNMGPLLILGGVIWLVKGSKKEH